MTTVSKACSATHAGMPDPRHAAAQQARSDDPRVRTVVRMEAHPTPATPKPWQTWAISILVALMPLSFSSDLRLKVVPTGLLFLTGLALLIGCAGTRRSFRVAWPPVTAALLMTGFVIINVLVHRLGWRPLDRPGHILLFLATAACFSLPLRMRLVWVGFSLTAIALGATGIVQHHVLGIDRAYGLNGGASASIELATILLGLSAIALVQFLAPSTRHWEKLVHVVAMTLGMYGALLTQSRGPLLAFAPIFMLLVLLHAQRTDRWRSGVLLAGAVCVIAAAATFSMRHELVSRFEAIAPEVASFDHRRDASGAVRERLEMWRTAVRAFATHPVAGIGAGQFADYSRQEIAAGRSNPIIGRYNQPHNEYLEAAAAGGIPGLLVLLAVFLVPLRYFARRVLDTDDEIALPASIGVALIGLYMLCALTDSVFYRMMTQSFYFFLVLGLALRIGWLSRSDNA
ncbi:MAG: O-antigen ligase family protein [Rhodanobacter sp.]|nr:MAG: O-antigen ligase family protein [Rhodanobacter sp.]TAL92953.1 MAG: O-antigen ligase family protein [Rhodanobacter sp.]TAM41287.1 MAG: O-antigen ligase family protein [Rhodanobacter sp.]TAN28567.1 MAG: O-antigen ligase family protein [Rhodanobacter sp.]